MRGSNWSGLLLAWIAMVSLAVPVLSRAQGAPQDQQYVAYGNQLYAAKNYAQAIQYFSYAAKLNPSSAGAYQGLAYCYYAQGNTQYALAYGQKALQLNPGNAQLSQFVQGLQGQAAAPAAAAPAAAAPAAAAPAAAAPAAAAPAASTGQDAQYVAYGNQLYAARNYAQALQYFSYALKLNPNSAPAYQGIGYCYYATGNRQYALYYLQKALQLDPTNTQVAQVVQSLGGQTTTAVAAAASPTPSPTPKNETTFGVHLLGGTNYVFANPQQILDGATKGIGAGTGYTSGTSITGKVDGPSGSVSLSGVTPSMIALMGIEPFVQLGQNFEINLNFSYLPIGNLSYTWNDVSISTTPGVFDGYSYTYNNTGVLAGLGAKVLFGDSSIKGYFGAGADIAPIAMTFTKVPIDFTGTRIVGSSEMPSSGSYNTLAFGAHAKLGVDFYLGKSIALGPFVGFQYLSATNFQNGGSTLSVNPNNGDVDVADQFHTEALTLDYTSINGGVNLTFTF